MLSFECVLEGGGGWIFGFSGLHGCKVSGRRLRVFVGLRREFPKIRGTLFWGPYK